MSAGQAEIAQLDGAFGGEEEIGELEIAMQYAVGMEVGDGTQQLRHDALHLGQWERHGLRVHQPRQVVRAVLED